MIYNINNTIGQREDVINYCKEQKLKRVVDLGGSMYPWAWEVVTHYADLIDPKEYHQDPTWVERTKDSETIKGDLCDPIFWHILRNHPQFDFAICSQTLEDIRDPSVVINNLPTIAKEGFISIPSKYAELCFGIEGTDPKDQEDWGITKSYRGYMHHRWVFTILQKPFFLPFFGEAKESPVLIALPKLVFVENMTGIEWATRENRENHLELSFFWKNTIEFEFVNKDFLGPNPPAVLEFYRKTLNEGV